MYHKFLDWSFGRGNLTGRDVEAVQRVYKEIGAPVRKLIVTGECKRSTLEKEQLRVLVAENDRCHAPLFVLTTGDTVLMPRSAGIERRRVFEPATWTSFLKAEADSMGFDVAFPYDAEGEFYYNLLYHSGSFGKYCITDTMYDSYLLGVTLFNKVSMFNIRHTHIFAEFSYKDRVLVELTEEQLAQRDRVWDKSTGWVTNDELMFVESILSGRA